MWRPSLLAVEEDKLEIVHDEFLERMRTALFRAFEDPALTSARQALFTKKTMGIDINSYQIISEIESYATKLGYPILQ